MKYDIYKAVYNHELWVDGHLGEDNCLNVSGIKAPGVNLNRRCLCESVLPFGLRRPGFHPVS